MESLAELGYIKGAPTKVELAQVARNEGMAIKISNIANIVLFVVKVYLSISSRSLAVIASTLDSLFDLISGFILWFTSNAMKKPNQYMYPIGKMRMQPVGIIVFASAMATLGVQILFESGQQLLSQSQSLLDHSNMNSIIGVMSSVTVVKFVLMIYCQCFKNEIVKAYAQDHLFDVITNSVGLATAILAFGVSWWIDPVGAILIALYTIGNWAKTVLENVRSLVGKSAPPDYLAKLTYLIWNHHEEIKHIDTVRAYTFGFYYFVEVDIVLRGNMLLCESHDIGEALQMKLELLPEVERAFVHVDFEFTHKPEHKTTIG
ncbi:Metal tolerance protein 10 [Platanthera guangdongensis]|uniref:Metal tolerance protein 10 n=1 Tax=Platanthera guangdongensis TaxID=2320717 RepID=A0ABR2N2N2_9ASPA